MSPLAWDSPRFNFRVAGLALAGGRALVHRAEWEGFWTLPGGRVEPGEATPSALAREMEEELHARVSVGPLLWVVENFFDFDGGPWQEVCLTYRMDLPSEVPAEGEWEGEGAGTRLVFAWRDPATLARPFLPGCLADRLLAPPSSPVHLVHRDGPQARE